MLIPCYSSGVIYDLFECLSLHLEQSGLLSIPLYFISPIAEYSLAFSNILAEWLTQNKQSKVYIPEGNFKTHQIILLILLFIKFYYYLSNFTFLEPFPHANLTKNARLKHFSGIHTDTFNNEFKTPCVVFTGHPSLRFGDVVHLIELWGSSPNNLIVFTGKS